MKIFKSRISKILFKIFLYSSLEEWLVITIIFIGLNTVLIASASDEEISDPYFWIMIAGLNMFWYFGTKVLICGYELYEKIKKKK